jgi:hypothetical protein
MNVLIALFKTLLLSGLAATVMGVIGYIVAAVIAEMVVPGHNPHTDQLEKLGMAIVGAAVGASLGVLAVVSRAIYNLLNARSTNLETQL